MRDVAKYLSIQQSEAAPEVQVKWAKLEELYNKKLWHQLTQQLEDMVLEPTLQEGDNLVQLYTNFIADIESKMKPLTLVQILSTVLEKFDDVEEAIQFIEKIGEKVKLSTEAFALTRIYVGNIKLHKLNLPVQTKEIMEEVEVLLNEIDGVTVVHGKYYLLCSDYYKLQANHAEFYRSSLRFLGCIELESLSDEQKKQHAFFLCLAALLGKGVYNFGELLAHPILESLQNTENEWLIKLVFVFNAGNLDGFEKLRPNWESQMDLKANEILLKQKICLLALMEMTFKRPANDRQLTFQEIATETKLEIGEIEFLVMRALSQGLVKGSIDEVEGKVHLTWVQPRVLDKEQLKSMITRLNSWCKDVQSMEMLLENKAGDILTY